MWPVTVSRYGKGQVSKRVIKQILISCQMFWKKYLGYFAQDLGSKGNNCSGASGSKRPILEALTDSSKDIGAVSFQQSLAWELCTKTVHILWRSRRFICLLRRRAQAPRSKRWPSSRLIHDLLVH
jgi:hypothetical protein